jgi:hypothetical protein
MWQGAIVRTLMLKKLSAQAIKNELERVCGDQTVSLSVVKKWRKCFANGKISLADGLTSGSRRKAISVSQCEPLWGSAPTLRVCQKLRITKTACLRVLHEHLGVRQCYPTWVSHSMSNNGIQCWIAFSEEPLQVVCHARETNFTDILTSDESCCCYEFAQDSNSAPSTATLPTRTFRKAGTKRCLVSQPLKRKMAGFTRRQSF